MEVTGGRKANELFGSYTDVTNLVIKAKGGSNRITLNRISVPGAVTVTGGSGNDVVRFGGQFSAEGDLEVDLNGGNNKVLTDNEATVIYKAMPCLIATRVMTRSYEAVCRRGGLMIDTAGGADTIRLGQKNSYNVTIGEGVTVVCSRGENTISIDGAEVNRPGCALGEIQQASP